MTDKKPTFHVVLDRVDGHPSHLPSLSLHRSNWAVVLIKMLFRMELTEFPFHPDIYSSSGGQAHSKRCDLCSSVRRSGRSNSVQPVRTTDGFARDDISFLKRLQDIDVELIGIWHPPDLDPIPTDGRII